MKEPINGLYDKKMNDKAKGTKKEREALLRTNVNRLYERKVIRSTGSAALVTNETSQTVGPPKTKPHKERQST